MIVPCGRYRYQFRMQGQVLAVEDACLEAGRLTAKRESAVNKAVYEIDAVLDDNGFMRQMRLRYRRGPFARSAEYQVIDDVMQGSISTLSATSPTEVRLGRFREIDADLAICKALIVAHLREREQRRWTGRVALIDSTTLSARSVKHSYVQADEQRGVWLFEPAMGEQETLEFDSEGRLQRTQDQRGFEATLTSST
jgi:hypothetical protein